MKKINHPISFGSCEKGLTMIEVLISMAIFAIGFLAIAGLVAATAKNNTTGNTLTQATMLARARVEYLKTLSLNQLAVACPAEMEPETVDRIYSRTCKISPLGAYRHHKYHRGYRAVAKIRTTAAGGFANQHPGPGPMIRKYFLWQN